MGPPHVYRRNGRRHPGLLYFRHNNYRNPNRCQGFQLARYASRRLHQVGDPPFMSPRFYFLVHCGGFDRYRLGQLVTRHRLARHILRCRTLPLRTIHRSRICNCCRFCPLISAIHRLHPPQHLNENPLRRDIRGRKYYVFPTALPWPGRDAAAVFGLPRCLYLMKHHLLDRLINLPSGGNHVFVYHLRGIRRQAGSLSS